MATKGDPDGDVIEVLTLEAFQALVGRFGKLSQITETPLIDQMDFPTADRS